MTINFAELYKKAGDFKIPELMVKTQPDDVMKIMGTMIITRCEHVFWVREFSYRAISPLFDKVSEGERVPEYEVAIDDTGAVSARRL